MTPNTNPPHTPLIILAGWYHYQVVTTPDILSVCVVRTLLGVDAQHPLCVVRTLLGVDAQHPLCAVRTLLGVNLKHLSLWKGAIQ